MSSLSGNEVELNALRERAAQLISRIGSGSCTESSSEYLAICDEFIQKGGPKSDMIIKIGESFFKPRDRSDQGPHEDDPLPGSYTLDFDYLEGFMVDCFLAVGVPDYEARVSANVLIGNYVVIVSLCANPLARGR